LNSKASASGVHLWLVLWKAARTLEAYSSQSIEALGICRSDFGVLEALLHKGPLNVNVLGAKVLLTSGSITTAVDRLERRGFVERRGDPNDRRARVVHLTHAGRTAIRQMFPSHERAMERAVSTLTAEQRVVLVNLLRKLGLGTQSMLEDARMGPIKTGNGRARD
jgi:MarR family transcriptional regulator, 2-MHQ and catechol-resistance regulon repressor